MLLRQELKISQILLNDEEIKYQNKEVIDEELSDSNDD
jgi:hypothetical protein